ncbi:MAG: DNA-3-methyladenine glycosylase I [Desulfuromonas sp.]|nr:MAG: DNA-3-methyladenine glycosylase I [Desulfuromonas sp.]
MPLERCGWCGVDPLYQSYHDDEWGAPLHDEMRLFEMLVLEGAQAGLSWLTILRKRPHYRRLFAGFDAEVVARFTPADVTRLLGDPGIVRNRLKVEAAIGNAQVVLAIRERYGSLDSFLWRFVDGVPLQNTWHRLADVPSVTPLAEKISRELKGHGCRFVGPTICYAYMQAIGMVNDHLTICYRHKECAALAAKEIPNVDA